MKILLHSIDYDKLLSLTFSCLLFFTAVICISTGFIADGIYESYRMFTTSNLLIMSYIISIAGVFALLASLLTMIVAYQKDQWLYVTIALFLGLSTTMALAASISGISFNKNTSYFIQERMQKSMKLYGGHRHADHAWDYVQNKFDCCGVDSYADWIHINKTIPEVCCASKMDNETICMHHKVNGCYMYVSDVISGRTTSTSKMGLIASLLQFTGLCAVMFIRTLFQYMEHKRKFGDRSFLKNNIDVFTVDPFYYKLEK